jgi:hypothetical protein
LSIAKGKFLLFAVLSLFTLYLFAIGYALSSLWDTNGDLLEQMALSIAAGMLVNLELMLTGQPIGRVLIGGTSLGLWGAWKAYRNVNRTPGGWVRAHTTTVLSLCFIAYVLVAYYFRILSEPLSHWDARSIWFFHARMIWIEGALRNAGWNHPSIAFSSPDYPKLVPAMAAQLAYLKGYWNEFLPKGSLFVMLTPAVVWAFSFRKRAASFVLLILMFFFGQYEWLSNGLMDAYLVIYSGLTLLFVGRYVAEGRDFDLHSALCALGIAMSLKNEGLPFALCLVVALLLVVPGFTECRLRNVAKRTLQDTRLVALLLIFMAPTVTWTIDKGAWGLQNTLTKSPSEAWSRALSRAFDGFSVRYVLEYLAIEANGLWVPAGLVAITMLFSIRHRWRIHPGARVAALTAMLHFCGMVVAYLSTPATLYFHLTTSATRTMASTRIAFLVSMFFLLSEFETAQGWPGPSGNTGVLRSSAFGAFVHTGDRRSMGGVRSSLVRALLPAWPSRTFRRLSDRSSRSSASIPRRKSHLIASGSQCAGAGPILSAILFTSSALSVVAARISRRAVHAVRPLITSM